MIRKSNVYVQNGFVSVLLLIALVTQMLLQNTPDDYFTVFLSGGGAAGLYISLGKKVLPGITLTTLFGVFFIKLSLGDSFVDSILFTFPIIFINLSTALLLGLLLRVSKSTVPDTFRKGLLFFAAVTITTMLITILPAAQYTISNGSRFFWEYQMFFRPLFVGLFVFSSTFILSFNCDSELSYDSVTDYKDILFIVIFNIVTYLIFSNEIEGINFTSYGAIFILLFMINAFIFNYRMLIFVSYIYLSIYNVVYFRILELTHSQINTTAINSFLIILLIISIFTKILIRTISEKNVQLTVSKGRYEEMLHSTFELLKVRDTLTYDDLSYHETYMKNIFGLATKIFQDIDCGLCILKGNTNIEIVEVKGYDIDYYRSLKFKNSNYNWDSSKPTLYKNIKDLYLKGLSGKRTMLERDIPPIKESVSIIIQMNEEKGAITFDILKGNSRSFTEEDIYNIGAFQSMINSFYEMNELAIKNNSLKDDMVLSLIRTLELYDHYTGGHSEDVATIANMLSEKLNLSKSERYDVYWAGIVHDIGKIGISSDIINKTSRLTLEEYKKVQLHAMYGYDVLNRSTDLKNIAILVKHHHEWYNGGGYPSGLKGDKIPFGAQILQVADSVSSMATKRSYQEEKSFEKIIDELDMYRGTQFNPIITDCMIELIEEGVVEEYFKKQK